jgi:uncharacterized protein (TIGR02246 family)
VIVDDDLPARLERLETVEAARGLVALYADAVDAQDFDALAGLFAPDAVVTARGRHIEGRDAIVDFYRAVFADDPSTRRHFVTNVRVVDASPTSATLASYFLFFAGSGGESILGWGRYLDRCARFGAHARFSSKDIEVAFRGPVAAAWGAGVAGA